MKVKLSKIVTAHKALGEAKVTKLEEAEVIKVIKARKAMRPHVEDYDAFLKDAQEKFKPEGWDGVQEKLQKWQQDGEKTTLTDEEKKEVNLAVSEYQKKIEAAIKEELEKEIELEFETISEDSATKMLVENGWELKKLDEIEAVL